MKRVALVILFALPAAADEVPLTVNHSGRLLDGNDQPVEGAHDFTFKIYTLPLDIDPNNPEAPTWTGVYDDVSVTDGLYTVELGATPAYPIPASLFDGSGARWLGITVDAEPEMKPRLRIGSTPHALLAGRALEADLLEGHPASYFTDAANLTGTAPRGVLPLASATQPGAMSAADKAKLDTIDPDAALHEVTGAAPISVTTGNSPVVSIAQAGASADGYLSAADWNVFNDKLTALSVSAPLLATPGLSPQISLPRASGSASGYLHSDDFAAFSTLVASVDATAPIQVTSGRTPVVSIANATPTSAGAMSAADKAKLDGLFQLLSARPANPAAGTVIYNTTSKALEFYTGTEWVTFFRTVPRSCKEIYDGGITASGTYAIQPSPTYPAMNVFCDMSDGGGWTLCASLTKGYVPSHMLYNADRYAFQARKSNDNDNYVYEREAPARTTTSWDNSETLNYGQFCRIMSGVNETRVWAKLFNWANASPCGTGYKGRSYDVTRTGYYAGHLFNQWFNNSDSGTFSRTSGDGLCICKGNNTYGGGWITKSVKFGSGAISCSSANDCGGDSAGPPYTHSTNPWGTVSGGGCVGCTSTGCYGSLPYGQTGILNNLSHSFWSGIPNVKYGWSDCTGNGNCDYHESGYGVWLFYVR